ncbi:putative CID domain, mRNA splicing factor Cwf21 domain-containing protein [Helianthus anomalus]
MQGDTLHRWRTEPFIMITGSGRWVPPALPTAKSPENEETGATFAAGRSRRVEPERTLTDAQRDEFEDMLRALTLERTQIKEAMGFALDNADAAGEIVEVLTESLTLKETPIPTKVARLMLVSDILHNSSAPVKNASAYRTKFEANLPDILESFNDLYRTVTGRITAEALKERVLKVLQVWADWFLFSDAYVNGLRSTFLRSGNSGVVAFHSILTETEDKTNYDETGDVGKANPDAALAIGKSAATKELMSLPLAELERRCRHNGLSLVGGREMMVARLLYLEESEKQRGYELTDNLKYSQNYSRESGVDTGPVGFSGRNHQVEDDMNILSALKIPIPEPELKSFPNNTKPDFVLPASKWAREDDESDDEPKSNKNLALGYSSSGSENDGGGSNTGAVEPTRVLTSSDSGLSEEKRQKLRQVEAALIEYRESLEERGIKKEEIEKKVVVHQKQLQYKYGLTNASEDTSNKKGTSSTERREKREDSRESSRKRHRSHHDSESPPRKSSSRDREKGRSYDQQTERDHDRDRRRDRDRDTRRR